MIRFIAFLFILLSPIAAAAGKTNISVNMNGNYFFEQLNKDSVLNPGNALDVESNVPNMRSDISAQYGNGEFNVKGAARYFLNPPFPVENSHALPSDRNVIFLDEANVEWKKDYEFKVVLGRQKFFWGPGFIKNPINLLNPPTDFRNPYFSLEEKSGVTGLSAAYYSGNWSITGVIVPNFFQEKMTQSYAIGGNTEGDYIAALKFDTLALGGDLTAVLYKIRTEKPEIGFAFSKMAGNVEVHGEALFQQGNRRIYIDPDDPEDPFQESFRNSDRIFGKYLIGLRYRSISGYDFLIEYYRDDTGYGSEQRDEFIDLLNDQRFLAPGNQLFWEDTLRRDYLFLRVGLTDILPKLSLNLLSVINLDDGSVLTGSGLEYRISEKLKAYTDIRTSCGSEGSEFGMIPASYTISSGIKISII